MMRQYELVDRVRRYNPDTDEALLDRAYVYAMRAHGSQVRASGDPYFSHPLEVAAILTDLQLDDATIVAALLHDTIEDTSATRAEIEKLFGVQIADLVEGLTKIKRLDLVSKQAKQAENLRKLLLAIADDVRVLLVKLADRLHNMRTLKYVPPKSGTAWRRKPSTSTRRWRPAWACRTCARNWKTSPSASFRPMPTPPSPPAWTNCGSATASLCRKSSGNCRANCPHGASPPR